MIAAFWHWHDFTISMRANESCETKHLAFLCCKRTNILVAMSKLPKPSTPVRDFEYVSDDDSAAMLARLLQHFGAAGVHVLGHVVQAIRTLCERSLLPPLTVLDELLAKISRNARLPDIIARVRSLTAPPSAPQVQRTAPKLSMAPDHPIAADISTGRS
jgi:hypothetical protein